MLVLLSADNRILVHDRRRGINVLSGLRFPIDAQAVAAEADGAGLRLRLGPDGSGRRKPPDEAAASGAAREIAGAGWTPVPRDDGTFTLRRDDRILAADRRGIVAAAVVPARPLRFRLLPIGEALQVAYAGKDPALAKLDADAKAATPMPADVRAQISRLRGKKDSS